MMLAVMYRGGTNWRIDGKTIVMDAEVSAEDVIESLFNLRPEGIADAKYSCCVVDGGMKSPLYAMRTRVWHSSSGRRSCESSHKWLSDLWSSFQHVIDFNHHDDARGVSAISHV